MFVCVVNVVLTSFNTQRSKHTPVTYGDESAVLETPVAHNSRQSVRVLDALRADFDAINYFDVNKTIDLIVQHRRKTPNRTMPTRVALQFPDNLLPDARLVSKLLIEAAKAKQCLIDLFILGMLQLSLLAIRMTSVDFCNS